MESVIIPDNSVAVSPEPFVSQPILNYAQDSRLLLTTFRR